MSDALTEFLYKELNQFRSVRNRALIERQQCNCFYLLRSSYYLILSWSKWFDSTIEESFPGTQKSLKEIGCEFYNCIVTSKRAFASQSKVVLFHWRDIDLTDLPPIRRTDQIWIIHSLESPAYSQRINDDSIKFNWTSSYRSSADIFSPYGKFVQRKRRIPFRVDIRRKSQLVAWVVSHCETKGGRERYVKQLQKYIPVDIFGKCGNNSCPERIRNGRSTCFESIALTYKFYLSFENSICTDYVTEKFFSIMHYDLIPIVFGGCDYNSLLPPNSFINALEFEPEKLAKLILTINKNDKMYKQYFKWKRSFFVESNLENKPQWICDICEKVNRDDGTSHPGYSLKEITQAWFERERCYTWEEKRQLLR